MNKLKDTLLSLPRQQVESSHIASVGYHEESRTLVVEFKTTHVYSYSPITQDAFNEFLNAPSKGTFLHEKIKQNQNVSYEHINKD